MPETPLTAHSVREISLYYRVNPCPACGHGPLEELDTQEPTREEGPTPIRVDARCRACDHSVALSFELPGGARYSLDDRNGEINESPEPSQIIDVPQWLTLYSLILDEASRETDKAARRRTQIRAGDCLTEALKFYDDPENDLPPQSACFCDKSAQKMKEQPEYFSRQRLIHLRASLPKPTTLR